MPRDPKRDITPDGSLSWANHDWIWGIGLLLAVFLAYLPVWHAGFIWDDDEYVTPIHALGGWGELKKIWTTEQVDISPLTSTTFWLERMVFGRTPLFYHLVSVLTHGACAVALGKVLSELRVPGAWLGAALWALHPVEVESVAWAAELKNPESGLFFLLAVLFFIKWLNSGKLGDLLTVGWRYALVVLFGAFAMACKSSTVILPVVLCLCAWWLEGRWRWRNLIMTAPLFLMSAMASFSSVWFEKQQMSVLAGHAWERSWFERFSTAGEAVWFYLGKLVWPHPLTLIYPHWQVDTGRDASCLPMLAIIFFLVLFWAYRQSWARPWVFVFAYFLVALLPVMGFIDNTIFRYSLVFDHLQYLASMGPLALIGVGLAQGAGYLSAASTWWRLSICGALLCVLGVATSQRARIFENSETLWSDAVAKNPECWVGYNNLGVAFLETGKPDEAINDFRKAVAIYPSNEDGYLDLGNALLQQGRDDEALASYQFALQINPASGRACCDIGFLLLKKGKVDEALTSFQEALKYLPESTVVHNDLADAWFRKGRMDQAMAQDQQTLALDPDNEAALYQLGLISSQQGRMDEAMADYEKVLKTNPRNLDADRRLAETFTAKGEWADAQGAYQKILEVDSTHARDHFALGLVYSQSGQIDRAIEAYQEALKLDPRNADAYTNLGNAFMQKGSSTDATIQYKKSLEINPDDEMTRSNLGAALYAQGQWDEAAALFQKILASNPKNDQAYFCLGLIDSKQGKLDDAVAEFRKALAINPNNNQARGKLAETLAQKQKGP